MKSTLQYSPPEEVSDFIVQIAREQNVIRITVTEPSTPAVINAFRAGFLRESGCRLILWDLRASDLIGFNKQDIQTLSASSLDIPTGNKLAFVVSTEVDFGMSRMISSHMEAHGSKSRIRQFYAVEEAEAWLLTED